MFNRFVQVLVVVVLLTGLTVYPINAQDDDLPEFTETFAFPSGVTFGYPETWALDEATVSDFMVMLTAQDVLAAFLQVYDLPALYGEMEVDLSFVQETYGSTAASTWGFEFDVEDFETVEVAERELSVLAFEGTQNDTPVVGYLVVIPYSEGGFGQITTYTVGEAPATYEQDVLAIAASMDIDAEAAGDASDDDVDESEDESEGESTDAASVDISDVELTETFAFSSEVTFGYPETWALDEATVSDFMVMLTAQDVLAAFLQVYDLPALYGEMEVDLSFVQETYGSTAASTWGFEFDVEDFETVEVAERELSVLAFEGTQNDTAVVGYLVVIPYSEGGFGQITTYAVGEAPATYEQDVLAIAASMDVEAE